MVAATAVGTLTMGESEIRMWSLPFTIGRSSTNTLTIRDPHLSRSHCEINQTPEGYEVRNLSSRNPVRVNGREISDFLLRDGDEIQISTHRFVFHVSGEEEQEEQEREAPAPSAEAPATDTQDEARNEPTEARTPTPTPPPPSAIAPTKPRRQASSSSKALQSVSTRRNLTGAAGKDRMVWTLVFGALCLVGLLGMGALMLRQGNNSRELTHAGVMEMQKMRGEISKLRMELGQTRNAYVTTERASRKRLRQLARQSPPQRSTARAARPRPSPQGDGNLLGPRGPGASTVTGGNGARAQGSQQDPPDSGLAQNPPRKAPDQKPSGDAGDPFKTPKANGSQSQTTPQPEPTGKTVGPPMIPFFGTQIRKMNIVFVVDKSSSMKPVMDKLYAQLDRAIDKLTEKHRFTIIFFDADNEFFSRKLVAGNKRYKALAKKFIRFQQPKGATDPLPALKAAMRYPDIDGLVFVTDGSLTDSEFKYLHLFLKNVTSGKMKNKKRVRLYLIHMASLMAAVRPAAHARLQKLLELAEKQDF